jgi:2-polyprenyl-6-methoxyphenol hydroxylase-like FAD-dependent oxidoreductase
MSPNLGQGANVTMTSGVSLAQTLEAEPDVPSGLDVWERNERPVADITQRYSRIYGRIGTGWPGWALDVRSAVVWGLGRSTRFQNKVNVATFHFPAVAPPAHAAQRGESVAG